MAQAAADMRVEQRSQLAAMQQLESPLRRGARGRDQVQGRGAGDPRRPRGRALRRQGGPRPLPAGDGGGAAPGADAAAADGRRLAGARRAPRGRPEEGDRAAGRRGADHPPAVRPAVHGPDRAARERGHPRADPRDPARDRAGRRGARRSASGSCTGSAPPPAGISVDISIFYGFLLVVVVLGVLAYLRAPAPEARPRPSGRSRSPRDRRAERPCAAATRWRRPIRRPCGPAFPIGERSRSDAVTTSRPATTCSR